MKFPLTKEEFGFIKSIEEKFAKEKFVSITKDEYLKWQDVLLLMEEKDFIHHIPMDGYIEYEKKGDLGFFKEWILRENRKAKWITKREVIISLCSLIIGFLLNQIPTLIHWLKD